MIPMGNVKSIYVYLSAYENNVVKENTGKQLWKDAVFPALTSEEDPPPPAPPLPKDEE